MNLKKIYNKNKKEKEKENFGFTGLGKALKKANINVLVKSPYKNKLMIDPARLAQVRAPENSRIMALQNQLGGGFGRVPVQPAQSQSFFRSTTFIVIMVILVLLIIGGVVYFFVIKKSTKSNNDNFKDEFYEFD